VDTYLGIGSNLGDRLGNLQAAVDALNAEVGIAVASSSRVWETDPVGGPAQPDFLNAVLRVRTALEPLAFLEASQRVEAALGRVRDVPWGPRTLDIDIELIGALVLDEPSLTIPHPRMARRAFVVLPLLELDADLRLPDGTRLVDLTLGSDALEGARPFAPPLRVSAVPA
jgi:2-amino-4-hydroxy-6-hydroxymethyldihydropteridine diphosphokinase